MIHSLIRRFELHPQYHYCQDVRLFQQARFAYYLSTQSISHDEARPVFLLDRKNNLFTVPGDIELVKNIERLEQCKPDVVVITTTYNRIDRLNRLYNSVLTQDFSGRIAWVIIENGSTNGTQQQLSEWSRMHKWIVCLQYKSAFGYATPARNRGLALVQMCLHKGYRDVFVWVVDSDDYLHNDRVVAELYSVAKRHPSVMTHGYAVVRYEDARGNLLAINTIPRNIGRGFPTVPSLKDELEMGPQVLSAMLPGVFLRHFYYPDEFTMEDDTLNQRIMAYALKPRLKIQAIPYPCLVKTFHAGSMANINDLIGRQDIEVQLGPKVVRGIRAQAVLGLQYIRDYFTREGI